MLVDLDDAVVWIEQDDVAMVGHRHREHELDAERLERDAAGSASQEVEALGKI